MKYLFPAIIMIHALIHLFGFLKAFQFGDFESLNISISKDTGLLWLAASNLLCFTSLLYILKNKTWWIIAIVSVALSQILIINSWSDAKYGTLLNGIILISAITHPIKYRFRDSVNAKLKQVQNHFDKLNDIEWEENKYNELPKPIKEWLKKSVGLGRKPILGTILKQELSLKMKPGQEKWIPGHAKQIFTVDPPSFIWTVNLKLNSIMKITGRDKFMNGKGAMAIKLFSILPIVNKKNNAKINEGALQRFLAETVWFPTAAMSKYIQWTTLDEFSAKATMEYNGTIGSGIFYFDEEYKFQRFEAMRFKDTDKSSKRIPWIVNALEHQEMNGILIPTQLNVEWIIEQSRWKWLELKITDIQYLDHYPNLTE